MTETRPVLLVTGASGGIGRSICTMAAARGWRVVVSDIDLTAAESLAEEIGEHALAVELDVSSSAAVDSTFATVERHWGPVQGLVNNAGFADQTPFLEMPESAWQREFDVMVSGAIHCIRRALPGMRTLPGSAIVNVASVNGIAFYSHPTYSAAKAALLSLSQSLAAICGADGIRINAVAPGTVLTSIWGADDAALSARTTPLLPYVPLAKFATPDDIASSVLFLVSPDAGHITGITLPVDGGLTTGILPMAHHINGTK